MQIRDDVIELLKTYKSKKYSIEQLRYELKHPPRVSEDAIIKSHAISSGLPEPSPIHPSNISDKTMMIALKYHEEGITMMSEAVEQIIHELEKLEEEVERLEHYLCIIEPEHSDIIRMYYFESKQMAPISRELGIGRGTVKKRIEAAVDSLTALYENYYRLNK